MLSIAMQRLFRETLNAIEKESPPLQTVEAAALWCTSYKPFSEALRRLHFSEFESLLSEITTNLPALHDVTNQRHEVALWDNSLAETDPASDCIAAAVRLAVTLLARPGALADNFERATGSSSLRLDHYPINVESFSARSRDIWPQMSLPEWMSDTLCWIMSTHRQVALRKLAQSGDDTRRLRMGDDGLYFDGDVIDVARTQPRLNQAFRFLHDLGLIERAREGRLPRSTAEGQLFLRKVVNAT